jgi:hypothetical protein
MAGGVDLPWDWMALNTAGDGINGHQQAVTAEKK